MHEHAEVKFHAFDPITVSSALPVCAVLVLLLILSEVPSCLIHNCICSGGIVGDVPQVPLVFASISVWVQTGRYAASRTPLVSLP
jgi:hypothetical protein